MDSLRSNPVSYKGAALTGRSCAERILVLKTAIHYFNRFDVCGQMNGVRRLTRWILAAKLNISFLNLAGCIAEITKI